jgi:hypothetical protein
MADVPVCNPFSKYEDVQHYSTCKNSAIEYGAFGGNLTVAASLSDCGKTNGTSEISAYFADKRLKLVPAESYIFEYTISTTSKYGSCIVALQTADGATILDQNGIANSPEADTSKFSLHKWYERKFLVHRDQLPSDSSVRLALTCASVDDRKVEVYVNKITLGRSGINKPDFVLFDPISMCPACKGSAPVPSAKCVPNPQTNDPKWVVDGTTKQKNITIGDATTFNGDLFVDRLDVSEISTLRLTGCLYSLQQSSIELIVFPNSGVQLIFHGNNCPTPSFSIVAKYDRDERCEYKLMPKNVLTVESALFYSVHYLFDVKCESPDRPKANLETSDTNHMLGIVILMVFIGVGATVGVSIYVVQRHKQKKVVAKFQQIPIAAMQSDITL